MTMKLLSKLKEHFDSITKANEFSTKFSVGWHGTLTFIIFLPCIVHGALFVGSTDLDYTILQFFQFISDTIHQGEFPLWNPLLQNGFDFSGNAHNYLYSPLNWPFFLFPARYTPAVLTFIVFIDWWLLGVLGFLFLREETGNSKWAIVGSTIFQLSGYTYVSAWNFPNLSTLVAMMFALYLIWTLEKRNSKYSFGLLTLSFCFVMLTPNFAQAVGIMGGLCILFLYRYGLSALKPWGTNLPAQIFYGGLISSLLISSIRILPTISALFIEKSRILAIVGYNSSGPGLLSTIPAIVPETFSVGLYSSYKLLGDWFGPAGDLQHVLFYLGQITLCLILFAIILPKDKKTCFWLVFGFLVTGWGIFLNPLHQIFNLLAVPALHPFLPISWISLSLAALVANTGLYLEKNDFKISRREIKLFLFLIFFVMLIGLLGYGQIELQTLGKANWYKVATVISLIFLYTTWRLSSFPKKLELWIPRIALGITLLLAALITPHIYESISSPSFLYQEGLVACFLTVLSTMGIILLLKAPTKNWKSWFLLIFSIVALLAWSIGQVRAALPATVGPEVIRILVTFGVLRFFLTMLAVLFVFSKVRSGLLHKRFVVPIFVLLLAFDLISFGNYFGRFMTSQNIRPVLGARLYHNQPIDYADISTQGRIPSRGYTPTKVSDFPVVPGDQIQTEFSTEPINHGVSAVLRYPDSLESGIQEIWIKAQSDKPVAFKLSLDTGKATVTKDYLISDTSEVWLSSGLLPFPVKSSVYIQITSFDPADILIKNVVAVKKLNLFKNSAFESWAENRPTDWGATESFIFNRSSRKNSQKQFEIQVSTKNPGNIAQVIPIPPKYRIGLNKKMRRFTFGAWIKAPTSDSVKLIIRSEAKKPSGSFGHKGQLFESKPNQESNKWEWLSVTIDVSIGVGMLRNLHTRIERLSPGDFSIFQPMVWEHAGGELKVIDNKRFRANNPLRLFGMEGHEPHTNLQMGAGIRTYGGFNSSTSHFLIELVKGLAPTWSNFRSNSGLAYDIKDDRLLDILGVGYDWQDVVRPNPLSRMMIFRDFEVIESGPKTIEIMNNPSFNPLQKVILSEIPNKELKPQKHGSYHLDFPEPRNNRVAVTLNTIEPAILLFNDSYHPDWVAYVNGDQKPVIRANHAFMATVVPAGTSSVEFVFEPKMFHFSKYLTFIGLILLTIGVLGFIRFPHKQI